MGDFRISKNITVGEDSILNFGTSDPFPEYISFIKNSIKQIITSQNPRLLILESWLLLDYSIRQLIIWGIGAYESSNRNFDLRNELLPISFKACIDFLGKYITYQQGLPIDPNSNLLKLPLSFSKFIYWDIEPEETIIINKIIDRYNMKMNPSMDPIYLRSKKEEDIHTLTIPKNKKPIQKTPKYRTVSPNWMKTASCLDESWFKQIRKINNARNRAAHSYNEGGIYSIFALKGKNKFERLKEVCIDSVEKLLAIKIEG